MEIPEQALMIDLPTLLVNQRTARVAVVPSGIRSMGEWAIEGTAQVGLSLGSEADDPSRLSVSLRLLTAHYSPPVDCPGTVLELVNRVNRDLAKRLLIANSPTASA